MDREIVLITGSSGFIGSALAKRLISLYSVVGIDKRPSANRTLRTYIVDISKKEALEEVVDNIVRETGRIDYVFHLAAYYDFSNRNSRLYYETNEEGTRNLLEVLRNSSIKTFIFTSSVAVMPLLYGDGRLNETSPAGASLAYGRSKLHAEESILKYKERLKVVIVRLAGVYSRDCHLIPLAQQIASIYRGSLSSRLLAGRGEGGISYVHIEDVLCGLEKIMTKGPSIPSGSIYIFSEEDYIPIRELYEKISGLIKETPPRLVFLPAGILKPAVYLFNLYHLLQGSETFFRPWMIDFSLGRHRFSIEKAKGELGWQPGHNLRDYLKVILNTLNENPTRWFEVNGIS